jgi:hypothetical protein
MIHPLFFAGLLVLTLALNLVGISIGMSTKWIKVEYRDASNRKQNTAYFADGASLGWCGILGGTEVLYHAMKEQGLSEVYTL